MGVSASLSSQRASAVELENELMMDDNNTDDDDPPSLSLLLPPGDEIERQQLHKRGGQPAGSERAETAFQINNNNNSQ